MGNEGWLFPVECDRIQGRIRFGSIEDTVRQSVRMILSTKKGERFLHPEFGCDVYKFLFRGTDYTTLKQIEHEILSSILAWEPRIGEVEVRAFPDNENSGNVKVEISYVITELNANIKQTHVLDA